MRKNKSAKKSPTEEDNAKKSQYQNREYKFDFVNKNKMNYTFETVKGKILLEIQQTFDKHLDVYDAIDKMKEFDKTANKPKLERSKLPKDDPEKERENRQFEKTFEYELKKFDERIEAYTLGMRKAYALILSDYCAIGIESSVRNLEKFEDPNDETKQIKNNPIKLLEEIRKLIQAPSRGQYDFQLLDGYLTELLNIRQKDDEHVTRYYERFKSHKDVVLQVLGSRFLDKWTENREEYKKLTDVREQAKMKENAFEAYMAYKLIAKSDWKKYGSLVTKLASNCSLGVDNYPKTIRKAYEALVNHKHDKEYVEKKKQNEANDDDDQIGRTQSFMQNNGDGNGNGNRRNNGRRGPVTCFCCGEQGHPQRLCPKKDTLPESEWYRPPDRQNNNWQRANSNRSNTENEGPRSVSSNNSRGNADTSWANIQRDTDRLTSFG